MFGYFNYTDSEELDFAKRSLLRLEEKLVTLVEKEDYNEEIFKRIKLNIKCIKYYYSL